MPDHNQICTSDFKPRQLKSRIIEKLAQTLNETFPTLVERRVLPLGFEEETAASTATAFSSDFPSQRAFIWLAAGERCRDSQVTQCFCRALLFKALPSRGITQVNVYAAENIRTYQDDTHLPQNSSCVFYIATNGKC